MPRNGWPTCQLNSQSPPTQNLILPRTVDPKHVQNEKAESQEGQRELPGFILYQVRGLLR